MIGLKMAPGASARPLAASIEAWAKHRCEARGLVDDGTRHQCETIGRNDDGTRHQGVASVDCSMEEFMTKFGQGLGEMVLAGKLKLGEV